MSAAMSEATFPDLLPPSADNDSSSDDSPGPRAGSSSSTGTKKGSSPRSKGKQKSMEPKLKFTEQHQILALRLGPLRRVQTELEHRLGSAAMEPSFTNVTSAAPFNDGRPVLQEFSINSTNGWKSALDKFRGGRPSRTDIPSHSLRRLKSKEDETAEVIAGCRDDIKAIWEDPVVKEMLARKKVRIEDTAGLYVSATSPAHAS